MSKRRVALILLTVLIVFLIGIHIYSDQSWTNNTQAVPTHDTVLSTPTNAPTPTATKTPAPTTMSMSSPSPTPTTLETYVVQSGDTLASISEKFGLDMNLLWKINKLSDPNMIYPGDVLVLKENLVADPAQSIPTPDISVGKEIIVVIHSQKTYAFEDGKLLKTFVVSTGIARYPTVIGHYDIYIKLRYTNMTGPGYNLPNVPYTMYFYQGYGLHGTYWHHNFGTPMSHGCVNLETGDAEWLYNWAKVGTVVWTLP